MSRVASGGLVRLADEHLALCCPRFPLFLLPPSGSIRRDDVLAQCFDPCTRPLDEPLLACRSVQPLIAHRPRLCGSRTDWNSFVASPGIGYVALVITLAWPPPS